MVCLDKSSIIKIIILDVTLLIGILNLYQKFLYSICIKDFKVKII